MRLDDVTEQILELVKKQHQYITQYMTQWRRYPAIYNKRYWMLNANSPQSGMTHIVRQLTTKRSLTSPESVGTGPLTWWGSDAPRSPWRWLLWKRWWRWSRRRGRCTPQTPATRSWRRPPPWRCHWRTPVDRWPGRPPPELPDTTRHTDGCSQTQTDGAPNKANHQRCQFMETVGGGGAETSGEPSRIRISINAKHSIIICFSSNFDHFVFAIR